MRLLIYVVTLIGCAKRKACTILDEFRKGTKKALPLSKTVALSTGSPLVNRVWVSISPHGVAYEILVLPHVSVHGVAVLAVFKAKTADTA